MSHYLGHVAKVHAAVDASAGVIAAQGLRLAALVLAKDDEVAKWWALHMLRFSNMDAEDCYQAGLSDRSVHDACLEAMNQSALEDFRHLGKPPERYRKGAVDGALADARKRADRERKRRAAAKAQDE